MPIVQKKHHDVMPCCIGYVIKFSIYYHRFKKLTSSANIICQTINKNRCSYNNIWIIVIRKLLSAGLLKDLENVYVLAHSPSNYGLFITTQHNPTYLLPFFFFFFFLLLSDILQRQYDTSRRPRIARHFSLKSR